jgi:hypothetical protein
MFLADVIVTGHRHTIDSADVITVLVIVLLVLFVLWAVKEINKP